MFVKRFINNWRLGAGKCVLIFYDEKWFLGLVTRKQAKCCEELGINPHTFEEYHKNHINKFMGIAWVGFSFTDSIESGGRAVKLHSKRAIKWQTDNNVQQSVKKTDLSGTMDQ